MSPAKKPAQVPPRSEQLINSKLLVTECPYCSAIIAEGLCTGFPVKVELQDLDIVGEVLALREGRMTFALIKDRGHLILDYRSKLNIEADKRRTRPKVVAQHDCKRGTKP